MKSLDHSQKFIDQLKNEKSAVEAENERMRKELEEKASLDTILSKLTEGTTSEETQETPEQKGMDEQTVQKLVDNVLTTRERQAQLEQNRSQVMLALAEKYGSNVKEVVANKAKELGVTPSQLGKQAEESPKLVLSLFGDVKPSSTSTSSSINLHTTPQKEKYEVPKPERSLLSGATAEEQAAYMREIKKEVYEKFDVQE